MKTNLLDLLRALAGGDIQFVIVGGVAALLEGAPITTLDLAAVIESKEVAAREKDLAMLPVLRRTLDLVRGSSRGAD